MTREKSTPPERAALHDFIGREAARLLSVYQKETEKQGASGSDGRRKATKAAALNLLCEIGAPPSLVILFNEMLGGVAGALSEPLRWADEIVDYEARAHNKNRVVDNAEIAKEILRNHPELSDRDHVMRGVREIRKAKWYKAALDMRRVYLMDNPETV